MCGILQGTWHEAEKKTGTMKMFKNLSLISKNLVGV